MSWSTPALECSTTVEQSKDGGHAIASRSETTDLSNVVTLRAGDLFDQVIRRDRTYGALLQEIKDAYEVYLGERDLPLPTALIPTSWATVDACDNSASLDIHRGGVHAIASPEADSSGLFESAVDAARRPWLEAEDDTQRGEFVKVREMEQENEALRALVQHLQVGGSSGRASGLTPAGAGINMVRQRSAARPPALPLDVQAQPVRKGFAADSASVPREPLESARSDTSAGSTLPWVSDDPLHRRREATEERRPEIIPELDFTHLLDLLGDEDYESSNDEEYLDEELDEGFQPGR